MERLVAIMERDDKLNHRAAMRSQREINRIYVATNATHIDRVTGSKVAFVEDRWGATYNINSLGYKFRWYGSMMAYPIEHYYQPIDEANND